MQINKILFNWIWHTAHATSNTENTRTGCVRYGSLTQEGKRCVTTQQPNRDQSKSGPRKDQSLIIIQISTKPSSCECGYMYLFSFSLRTWRHPSWRDGLVVLRWCEDAVACLVETGWWDSNASQGMGPTTTTRLRLMIGPNLKWHASHRALSCCWVTWELGMRVGRWQSQSQCSLQPVLTEGRTALFHWWNRSPHDIWASQAHNDITGMPQICHMGDTFLMLHTQCHWITTQTV